MSPAITTISSTGATNPHSVSLNNLSWTDEGDGSGDRIYYFILVKSTNSVGDKFDGVSDRGNIKINGIIIVPGVDLTGQYLSDSDFTGAVLTGANLTDSDLTKCTFTDVVSGNLFGGNTVKLDSDVVVKKGYLLGQGVNLTGAVLTDVVLAKSVNLAGADMTGADFTNFVSGGHILPIDGVLIDMVSKFWYSLSSLPMEHNLAPQGVEIAIKIFLRKFQNVPQIRKSV